jgi:Cu(I)/Ag(I) efflux system membrane protein CusA/SilA
MILYFTYNSMKEAFVTIITVPFAFNWRDFYGLLYDINLSVVQWVSLPYLV